MVNYSWFYNHRYLLILIFLGIIFFILYSWLYIGVEPMFNWPDETANYHFTKSFAENSVLKIYEPLGSLADGVVRPRSITYNNGYIQPGSFLGIILIFGLIAKIFGTGIIVFLTPLFSAIGVIFFYLLVRKLFSDQIAFFSSLLMYILPPYWYYASHGLLHNNLFLSLLIMGLFFLINSLTRESETKKFDWQYIIAGLFIGLSLIVRTSETIWVGLIILILLIAYRSRIKLQNAINFIATLAVIIVPILYLNRKLYGSVTSFAYSAQAEDASSLEFFSQTAIYKLKQLLFPFGFDWQSIIATYRDYLIQMFPWISILLVIGLFWYLRRYTFSLIKKIFPQFLLIDHISKNEKVYLLIYSALSIWLIIYYGSFIFNEHAIQTDAPIFGTSYMRYWLPIYVFGLPLAVNCLTKFISLFKNKIIGRVLSLSIIFVIIVLSIFKVVLDPYQGLIVTKKYINNNITMKNEVMSLTENNAIIITWANDKVFFPERKVIANLPINQDQATRILTNLTQEVPLYFFYSPFDKNSPQYLDQFQASHLTLEPIKNFDNNEILYKVY